MHVLRPRAVSEAHHDATFIARYLELVAAYVCTELVDASTTPCLELVALPDVAEQARIVIAMNAISENVDLPGLQGTFIRLLLMHDDATVRLLIQKAIEYEEVSTQIRSIIQGASHLGDVLRASGDTSV